MSLIIKKKNIMTKVVGCGAYYYDFAGVRWFLAPPSNPGSYGIDHDPILSIILRNSVKM